MHIVCSSRACPPGTGIDDLEVYERYSAIPDTFKASKTVTFLSEYTEDERYREYSAIIEAGLVQCTPKCAARPPLNTSDADIYIRDATGNVLAVYHYDRKTAQLRWSEQHLYGSARLGMYQPEKIVTSVSTDSKQREVGYLGKQVFELSNHLGNVLATITDKKLQVSTNTTSTDYFEADVQTVQDYYAFGMQMPGRKLSGGYRYGFNGKENDNEVKGEGNQQDYGMRIYDGRIGKFLSVDPITSDYPELTPYQFASNRPIDGIDFDGLEFMSYRAYKMNSPLTVMSKDLKNRKEKFENSRLGKATQGVANTTFGVIGTIGSGMYIAGTDGIGYALGGSTAMMFSLGEVGIGIAQITSAFASKKPVPVLENSSSIPGLIAYGTGYSYAGYIDAASQFLPGMLSGGNIKTILTGPKTILESEKMSELAFNSLSVYDALSDTQGLWGATNVTNNTKNETFSMTFPSLIKANSGNNIYSIRKGDNLSGIAKQFDTTVKKLAKINNITDVNKINVGDILKTK